ncbi:hypothetical protein M404DRAFT_600112 [Pisolithus tinctorius Marx 270]|uniref:Uncharacterized protein n=1 Tax=Pisolithus tinctorius Marx 270 TaxID=870435 RepID=A0A0C3K3F4_PISTI|nr:hypothetical protein M404DRAFT_600112 [Pisolithus tinctorius Marx 270]
MPYNLNKVWLTSQPKARQKGCLLQKAITSNRSFSATQVLGMAHRMISLHVYMDKAPEKGEPGSPAFIRLLRGLPFVPLLASSSAVRGHHPRKTCSLDPYCLSHWQKRCLMLTLLPAFNLMMYGARGSEGRRIHR